MKALAVCLLVVLMYGCGSSSATPRGIDNAARPVTVAAISDDGVVLTDADGVIYTYDTNYYFAKIIVNSGLKVGDVISN